MNYLHSTVKIGCMNAETIREYALSKPDAEESFPFGNETLVFKINATIFLLLSLEAAPLRFSVKCDPEKTIELRENYSGAVLPGYHMNKKHWNTIMVDGSLPARMIQSFIDDSYELVKKPVKKAKK